MVRDITLDKRKESIEMMEKYKNMKEFTEEEILKLHECLKQINIPSKLPPSEETNYYVDIFNLVLDKVSMNQRLAVLMYMSYETLFKLVAEKELISELIGEKREKSERSEKTSEMD